MTIPFLSIFKRKAPKAQPAPASTPAPVEKPEADRFSKTVMPNATRTFAAAEPQPFSGSPLGPLSAAYQPAAAPRSISFAAPPPGARMNDLPPAVALALEPRVERTICLTLAEVAEQMPAGMLRALNAREGARQVLLRAAELERGMANGKPSVSLAAIHQQLPEFFLEPVAASNTTVVQLPFHRLLEEFTKLQVRADQDREQAVPQVETPFLRVTLEDDEKFGTSIGPVQTAPMPSVRMQPATAETLAAAEPEPAAIEKLVAAPSSQPEKFRLPMSRPAEAKGEGPTGQTAPAETPVATPVASAPAPTLPAPARIPFSLSPNGTDAPAAKKVPAFDGPSVPTSSRTADPVPPAPARVAFKMTPLSDDLRPNAEPWLTKDSFESSPAPQEAVALPAMPMPAIADSAAPKIALPLCGIMQSLTPFQMIGDVGAIPADARIELPFSLVESQLASGRVNLTPEQFAAHLPEEYRSFFDASAAGAVPLPLHEVLKNIPATSLRMRDDQVEQEKGVNFATPFSAKAEEDAKRFKVANAPVPKPVLQPLAVAPAVEPPPLAVEPTFHVLAPVSKNDRKAPEREPEPIFDPRAGMLTTLNGSSEVDAKGAVALIEKMPGVKACALLFGDGLTLAGSLPAEYAAEGLCAMAPSLLQRIEGHMIESNLGALRALTLSCADAAVTFMMHGNVCLAALHDSAELSAGVRERLASTLQQLSRKYSN